MYYRCLFDCLSYFLRFFFSLYAKPVLKAMFSSYEETVRISREAVFFLFFLCLVFFFFLASLLLTCGAYSQ